ncbi:tetratricopeptide repeat-containing sensor histidine kinase [Pseudochryseolinea flava]|uniref:histidine kinase n=1 Tax=Pseudochryseolinea flava TaxID=2059302 RepID=A0A364XUA5_9BACT|nr:tetratricopeptide repeat protein [Pseudochryseolinea flava]RAV97720.1 hypothetical protein DQQ10_27160 [Pseudochryseolinea flava]
MSRRLLVIPFILSITLTLSAQHSVVDSLVQRLTDVENDTLKARLYKSIVEQTALYNLDTAAQYASIGLDHVKKMQWKKGIAVFHNLVGMIYGDKGLYVEAIAQYERALTLHRENHDDYNEANTLNNIGTAYSRQGVAEKANRAYFDALAIAEKIGNDELTALCLNNIAIVYFDQNHTDKAIEYNQKAFDVYRHNDNKSGMGEVSLTLANIFLVRKDSAKAINAYNEALTSFEAEQDELKIATVLTNLSMLYGQTEKNISYKLKAQEIWDRVSPAYPISITNLGNIGLFYLEQCKTKAHGDRIRLLSSADKYLQRALTLSKASGTISGYVFILGSMAELEEEKGNFKAAYHYSKLYHHLNDSIYSQESKNKIAAIEGQREVALRDQQLALHQQDLAIKRVQIMALIAGVVLFIAIGFLLYRQNRIRRKTNAKLLQLNARLEEANNMKMKFFAILSHDLRAPVARLINFLHLQKESPHLLTSDRVVSHQQKIVVSAENLLDDLESILLWSKGQMENFKPSFVPVPVRDLFDRLQHSFASLDGVSIVFKSPGEAVVLTDFNFVYTMMHNLTTNAVNVLKGKVDGKVEWSCLTNGEAIYLFIEDNGPGLPASFRLEDSGSKIIKSSSTGFGLYIIHDMAKAIGCEIDGANRPDGGAQFKLRFRRRDC